MGHGGHVLTFPVNHGKTVNVVAFHTTDKDWLDPTKLTAPASRADALSDFAGFGDTVTKLLQLAEPKLDTVSINTDMPQRMADNKLTDHQCSGRFSIWDRTHRQPTLRTVSASSAMRRMQRRRTTEPALGSASKTVRSLQSC